MKNKKKKYWFVSKNYGWGWTPATWQGWLILAAFIVFVFWRGMVLKDMFDSNEAYMWRYMTEIGMATIVLILICYFTGEKPRWRWGK